MLSGFIHIFKAYHPAAHVSPELHFRLELLRFTTLFCRRLEKDDTTPTIEQLGEMRRCNASRSRIWNTDRKSSLPDREYLMRLHTSPLSQEKLAQNRRSTLNRLYGSSEIPACATGWFGTERSISLLDLLPSFMLLSAEAAPDSVPSLRWMILAAEFMLQAALEQLSVRGETGLAGVTQAFSWGCWPAAVDDAPDDLSLIHI